MKSAKCLQCGFVGWADDGICKKCGAPIMATPASDIVNNPDGGQTYHHSLNANPFPQGLKTGLAVTSLVLGLVNFLFLGITVIPLVVGIVISVVALKRIKRDPRQYGGKGLAVAGLVMNIFTAVCLIPVVLVLAIAIPNVLAARRAAYEAAAINSLRYIASAEVRYESQHQKFGSVSDLERESLIAPQVLGSDRGYTFKLQLSLNQLPGFEASAVPNDYPSKGKRSFYIDETGVVRGADNHGLEATRSDPPLSADDINPYDRSASRRALTTSDEE